MSESKFEWTDELVAEYSLQSQRLTLWDFKRSKEVKDYEILSWNHYKTGGISTMPAMHINDDCSIHSVRRVVDGEVFTVNSENCVSSTTYLHPPYPNKPIRRFYITNGVMWCQFDEGNGVNDGVVGLNSIQKVKPKVPLFTTFDNIDKYEGDSVWYVTHPLSEPFYCSYLTKEIPKSIVEYFNTNENAEAYILNHKPVMVSLKELNQFIERSGTWQILQKNIHNLFKSKINP